MNEDTRAVIDGLDRALAESGLNQAEFAAALGTSAPRFSAYRAGTTAPSAAFYLRALRLSASLRAASEQGWMTPPSTSRQVRRALRQGDDLWALKMALQGRDQLRELLHQNDAAATAWASAPRTTGERAWDAFLAALTEHEFEAADREAPSWTEDDRNRLGADEEWTLPSLLLDEDEVRASTPAWLSKHGVYAAERDLVTA